jgi:hypothetical protein
MNIKKGDKHIASFGWECEILAKPYLKLGTVLVRWLSGDLKGREARILVKDIQGCINSTTETGISVESTAKILAPTKEG